MGINPRAIRRLLIPAVLLVLAGWGRGLIGELGSETLQLLGYLPYLLAIVCAMLAYQFNRGRFLLLALLTAASFWVIQTELQVSLNEPGAVAIYSALGYGIPLTLLLLLLVPEQGIINRWGLTTALAAGVLALAAPRVTGLIEYLLREYPQWLSIWPTDYLVLPWAATAIFAITAVAGLLALFWYDSDAEVALLASLVAGFVVLGGFYLGHVSVVFYSVAGLIQLLSILQSSHAMAYRDDLTGLLGRRALNERLESLGPRYAVAMVDVDHFKKFNDDYGHDVGDEVLKLVATRISRVGAGGTAFRYGGEEFCIVFPRKSLEDCVDALEAVRTSIADYRMTLRDKGQRPVRPTEGEQKRGRMATRIKTGTVAVTVSLGLAERSAESPLADDVLKAADQKLYRAKKAGRNRLCY